jgi:hypothetical protein
MTQDPDRLHAIAARQSTVADKIRALAAEGVPRADIARLLGKRYQHVRNVLEADAQSGAVAAPAAGAAYVIGRADLSGVQEAARSFDRERDAAYIDRRTATALWLRVRQDGSLVLPEDIADSLGAQPGDKLFATFEQGALRIISADAAMKEASDIVCKYIPAHVNLADELIADRRAEAAREEADG